MLSIHRLVDAERVCDRVVLLNNGKLWRKAISQCFAAGEVEGRRVGGIFLALT